MRAWLATRLILLIGAMASIEGLRSVAYAGSDQAQASAFSVEDYLAGRHLPSRGGGDSEPAVGAGVGDELYDRVPANLQRELAVFVERFGPAMDGDDPVAAVSALRTNYDKLKAHHLLYLASLDDAARTLAENNLESKRGAVLAARRADYEGRVGLLLRTLDDFYALNDGEEDEGVIRAYWERIKSYYDLYSAVVAIRFWIGEVEPRGPPVLRASTLPYRSSAMPARAPLRSASPITPTYEQEDAAADTADLSESPGVQFSDPLRLKAKELEFDPIRIFNFVRNEIRTEWYAGAVKGGEVTLLSRSGNDVDQAALLVALMRLSGVPSRFVHGVVELPLDHLRSAFGTALDSEALRALRLSGVGHTPLVRGGKVAAVRAERTWVSIKLPYSNYRGTIVDASGRIWLPLDPAFKDLDYADPRAVLAEMGLSAAARADQYLRLDHDDTLLDQLRLEAKTHLQSTSPGLLYDDVIAGPSVRGGDTGYLPTTLPYAVEQVNSESAQIAPALIQEIRFQIHSADDPTSAIILDETRPLFDVYNRRVTITYIPASEDDHELVRAFGGLSATPAFLIKVRPQLKLNGQLVATASEGMPVGVGHRLALTLSSPSLSETLEKTLISTSYHAIAVTMGDTLLTLDAEDSPTDTEFAAARILSQAALRYHDTWERAELELGALSAVSIVRPLPAVTFASNAVTIDFLLDQPQQVLWRGVELDAGLRIVEAIKRTAQSYDTASWYRLSALEGSILEHHLFERDFQVESISTDKVIALANQQGIEVVQLDSQNVATEITRLTHSAAVVDDISNRVFQGLTVTTPLSPLTHVDWSGSAWIAQDEQTGAAGYFLSGGIAGGATASLNWFNQGLRNSLQSPYAAEANTDSLGAAAVFILPGSDGQTGIVGQPLPGRLAVRVVDSEGRPVFNANVTFKIVAGGGHLGGIASSQTLATSEVVPVFWTGG